MPERRDPDGAFQSWISRHDDEALGQHPKETLAVGGALVLAALAFWGYLHQAELEVWARGHRGGLIGAGVLLALVVALAAVRMVRRMRRRRKALTGREAVGRWKRLTDTHTPLARALQGSKPTLWRHDQRGVSWTVTAALSPGHHLEEVVGLTPNLESAFRARPGSVRVTPDPARADRVRIQVMRSDLLADVIPWTPPEVGRSCGDPILLGTYEDGKPVRLNLTPEPGQQLNMLVAGTSGFGKTSFLHLLIANYAACRDAALVGIDPQGGGLPRWRGVFAMLAEDFDQTDQVLARMEELIDRRHLVIQGYEEPIWTPSRETPDVFLMVDEAADLTQYFDRLFQIARKGRKVGCHLVLATQRPSAAVIPKDLQAQLQVQVCMNVNSITTVDVVFGPGMAHAGWRPDLYCRERGEFVLRAPGPENRARAKAMFMRPDQLAEWAQVRSQDRTPLRLPRVTRRPQTTGFDLEEEPGEAPSDAAPIPREDGEEAFEEWS